MTADSADTDALSIDLPEKIPSYSLSNVSPEARNDSPSGDEPETADATPDVDDDPFESQRALYSFPLAFGAIKQSKAPAKNPSTFHAPQSDADDTLLRTLIRKPAGKRTYTHTRKVIPKHDAEEISETSVEKASQTNHVDKYFIPCQDVVAFEAHLKSVSAMCIHPKGTRLITGGFDAEIHMWDFNGMTSEPRPFRQFSPVGGHAISALDFAATGSHFACASGDAICRIYDIEGKKVQETVKGDMYVRDTAQTKGHTHAVNDCQFHPVEKSTFLTASSDATLRVFNLNAKPYGVDQALPHDHVYKALDKRNLNIAGQCRVTACRYVPTSGRFMLGGCSDGSLQLWDTKKYSGKPNQVVRTAHEDPSDILALHVFRDEYRCLSRATDHTLKLWDLRKFQSPVHVWEDLPALHAEKNFCINPAETLVVVGLTSMEAEASLRVFKLDPGWEKLDDIQIARKSHPQQDPSMPTKSSKAFSLTSVLWPEALNQLFVGSLDGYLRIYYDRACSRNGALLFVDKAPISRKETLEGVKPLIFTPDSLPPGFKQTRSGAIRRMKRHQILEANPPAHPPRNLPAEGSALPQHLTSPTTMLGRVHADDPVEALRAYAELTQKESIFVTKAYEKTQPIPVLDYSMEEGDDEKVLRKADKCPRCGLKLCQCGYMRLAHAIKGEESAKLRKT